MQQTLFANDSSPARTAMRAKKGIPIYRVQLVREGHANYGTLRHSGNATTIIQAYLEGVDREHFLTLLLDRKNLVIGIHTVAVGSLSSTIVHPREVFKAAILANAAAIICSHNHPSGDPTPSPEDKTMTTRLVEAGKLLGIQVLDHIVIGDNTSYSFADDGTLGG